MDAGDDKGAEAGAVYVDAGHVQVKELVQVQAKSWYRWRYSNGIVTRTACTETGTLQA